MDKTTSILKQYNKSQRNDSFLKQLHTEYLNSGTNVLTIMKLTSLFKSVLNYFTKLLN